MILDYKKHINNKIKSNNKNFRKLDNRTTKYFRSSENEIAKLRKKANISRDEFFNDKTIFIDS